LWIFSRNPTEEKCHFHHSMWWVHSISKRQYVSGFSTIKIVFFFCFLPSMFFGCSSHLRFGELCFISLREEYVHKLLKFCPGDLSLFLIYLLSQILISVCTLRYNPVLLIWFFAQIITALVIGALLVGFRILLANLHYCFLLLYFLIVCFRTIFISSPARFSWFILCISCLNPGTSDYLKHFHSFIWIVSL
jgi:hypothetical protein